MPRRRSCNLSACRNPTMPENCPTILTGNWPHPRRGPLTSNRKLECNRAQCSWKAQICGEHALQVGQAGVGGQRMRQRLVDEGCTGRVRQDPQRISTSAGLHAGARCA